MVILKLLLYLFVLVLVVFLAYYTTKLVGEKAQGENRWARASMSWNGQA